MVMALPHVFGGLSKLRSVGCGTFQEARHHLQREAHGVRF
jgi:hypothetical protein